MQIESSLPAINLKFLANNEISLDALFKTTDTLCGHLNSCIVTLVKFMKQNWVPYVMASLVVLLHIKRQAGYSNYTKTMTLDGTSNGFVNHTLQSHCPQLRIRTQWKFAHYVTNQTTDHCNTYMAIVSTSTSTDPTPTFNRHTTLQMSTSPLRSSTWAHSFYTPRTPGSVSVSYFRHCWVVFSIKIMTIHDTTPWPLAKIMLNHITTLTWHHVLTVVSPLSWPHGTGSARR